jgi:hypothetical protein
MSDDTNVIGFRPQIVGDGIKVDVDQILEANKGEFVRLVMVGERADGEIAVAGSDSPAESMMLLILGQNHIVNAITEPS